MADVETARARWKADSRSPRQRIFPQKSQEPKEVIKSIYVTPLLSYVKLNNLADIEGKGALRDKD